MICLLCSQEISNKHFSQHLKKHHQETPENYTLKYIFNGKSPLCKCGCGAITKYVNKEYRFNDYIHNHHKPTLGMEMRQETKKKISERAKERFNVMSESDKLKFSASFKERMNKSMLEKYGIDNIFKIKKFKGKDSWNWKGGVATLDQMIYSDFSFYKLWKYPILCRDHFKCVKCGVGGKKLNVHHNIIKMTHIVDFFIPKDKHELSFEEEGKILDLVVQYHIDNNVSGISLCEECHKKEHQFLDDQD